MKYYEDPILGKGRAADVSGGTGGGGGTDYVFDATQFTVLGDTVSITGTVPTATTANGVSQEVKDDIISSAGGGIAGNIATVENVMTGVTGGTQTIVDVDSLRGGLTAGQAVDVTSEPDDFNPSYGDYKGEFNLYSETLGFASFPKYAPGLKYLMIADLMYIPLGTGGATVAPGGTWLDGTTSPITLPAGEAVRVAMLFDTESTATFTFASVEIGFDSVVVSHLREYEVTACTPEAIAYIASLDNPDAFADYYLVKQDMVQPWTYIINMGASPATTVAAGLAYQIDCTSGSHIITVDTCPTGYVGRDTYVRLLVGETGGVVVQSPLKLGTPLVANAINNCEVKYRDGEAVLTVADTLGGYIVTDITGTTDGTLYYGLTASNASPYITFSPVTDGQTLNLSSAVISGTKIVVGNGAGSTILTGAFKPSSTTQLVNLSLANVDVLSGGYMLLKNGTEIASGASVTFDYATVQVNGGTVNGTLPVSRGTLQLLNAGGTGTIDLNNLNKIIISSGASASVNGLTITNGRTVSSGGAFLVSRGASLALSSNVISGNTCTTFYAGAAAVYVAPSASMSADHCTFASNYTSNLARDIWIDYGANCTLKDNTVKGGIILGSCTLVGSNAFGGTMITGSAATPGSVFVSSGAIIDLTGNTNARPISPGGTNNITFGANVTIINSAGISMSLNNGAAGSCTSIKKDGTTE